MENIINQLVVCICEYHNYLEYANIANIKYRSSLRPSYAVHFAPQRVEEPNYPALFSRFNPLWDYYVELATGSLDKLQESESYYESVIYHDIFKDSATFHFDGGPKNIKEEIDRLCFLAEKLLDESQMDYDNRLVMLKLEYPTKDLRNIASRIEPSFRNEISITPEADKIDISELLDLKANLKSSWEDVKKAIDVMKGMGDEFLQDTLGEMFGAPSYSEVERNAESADMWRREVEKSKKELTILNILMLKKEQLTIIYTFKISNIKMWMSMNLLIICML